MSQGIQLHHLELQLLMCICELSTIWGSFWLEGPSRLQQIYRAEQALLSPAAVQDNGFKIWIAEKHEELPQQHICHTYIFQIMKEILILDYDNPSK